METEHAWPPEASFAAEWPDSPLEAEAEVACLHCGESVTIGLDPGGGVSQIYVEDCQVCCRPWQVRVSFAADGSAEVDLEPL